MILAFEGFFSKTVFFFPPLQHDPKQREFVWSFDVFSSS